MANNSLCVLTELKELLERWLTAMSQLADTYESHDNFEETRLEKKRLEAKRDALKMVIQKVIDLENE